MRAVKIAGLLTLLGLAALGLSRISFDVDVFKMLPSNLRQAEGLSLFLKHFARPDELLVTLEADTPETAAHAADELAAVFQKRPDLAARVTHRPRWESQPEELAELAAYLLLNAPPDKVRAAAERASPDHVSQTLQETLAQLAESVSPAEVVQLSYDPLRFSETLDGLEKAAKGAPGEFASADGTFRVIYLDAAPKLNDYRDSIRWVDDIHTVAEAWNKDPRVKLGFTGEPVFMAEISRGMEADMKSSGFLALGIIAGLFWLCYRRLRPLLALVVMLLLIFLLSLAAAGLFLSDLTVMGVGFAAIMIGLSVDYGYLIYHRDRIPQRVLQHWRRVRPRRPPRRNVGLHHRTHRLPARMRDHTSTLTMPCDYSKYPKDWKAIRAEVLERAGHKCEQCGVLNHDHVWRGTVDSLPVYQTADCAIHSGIDGSMVDESGLDAWMKDNPENKLTKIVLTISHTDHDITNNGSPGSRPNLKALCQRCHLCHDHHHHQANARQTRTKRKGMAELFT